MLPGGCEQVSLVGGQRVNGRHMSSQLIQLTTGADGPQLNDTGAAAADQHVIVRQSGQVQHPVFVSSVQRLSKTKWLQIKKREKYSNHLTIFANNSISLAAILRTLEITDHSYDAIDT